MSLLAKLGEFVGGGLFNEVKSLVQDYFPPDMSPQQRAELEIKLQEIAASKEIQANRLMLEAEQALTQRITQLEGSAQDLRAVPFVGPLVIFLRGLQRPLWGYAVLYIDFMWFSGKWQLEGQQESAMWVINLLVLGFLFGERAVQNLAPLISELINKRTQK
jgi:hypothetical protein